MRIDERQMQLQETKDFIQTKEIMKNIFQSHGFDADIQKTPKYFPVDAIMNISKGNNFKKTYTIEIKESIKYDEYYNGTMQLKVSKYCGVMDYSKGKGKPIVIYLIPKTNNYYIFDLSKLDLNKVILQNVLINKIEYVPDGQKQIKELTPMFNLPIEMAVNHGKIPIINNLNYN